MLYSGADLIRTSGQQQVRALRLADTPRAQSVQPVAATGSSSAQLNKEDALLRFAHFIADENGRRERSKKRPKKTQINPYIAAAERQRQRNDLGQMLDVLV